MPKFEICRTSGWDSNTQPCQGASRDGDRWLVDLETLEDLLVLMDQFEEPLIVSKDGTRLELEIYDDYRE